MRSETRRAAVKQVAAKQALMAGREILIICWCAVADIACAFAAFVVGVDEPADGGGEVVDGGEAAAADGLAGDDRREGLDVGPAGRRRR